MLGPVPCSPCQGQRGQPGSPPCPSAGLALPTGDSGGDTQAGGNCLIGVNGNITGENSGIKKLVKGHHEETDTCKMGLLHDSRPAGFKNTVILKLDGQRVYGIQKVLKHSYKMHSVHLG